MCIFSSSAKFFAARSYFWGTIFFGHNGLYLQHWSFGAVASLKILATENMPRLTAKLRIVVLDSETQPSLNGSPRHLHTSLLWDQGWKPTCEHFSLPPPKYGFRNSFKFTLKYRGPPSIDWAGDSSWQSYRNNRITATRLVESEQFQIGNWVEIGQNYLALSSIQFTQPTRTRQNKTVWQAFTQGVHIRHIYRSDRIVAHPVIRTNLTHFCDYDTHLKKNL